jgi:hypothetical protein
MDAYVFLSNAKFCSTITTHALRLGLSLSYSLRKKKKGILSIGRGRKRGTYRGNDLINQNEWPNRQTSEHDCILTDMPYVFLL